MYEFVEEEIAKRGRFSVRVNVQVILSFGKAYIPLRGGMRKVRDIL